MAPLSSFLVVALVSSATAFTMPLTPRFSRASVAVSRSSPTARNLKSIYEQPEVEEIAHTADDLAKMAKICQDDGCSVEAVAKLVRELKAKRTELEYQLTTVSDLIDLLAIPDSEPNEWDQWVEAIFRVFDIGGRDIGDIDPIDYPKTLEDFQKDTSIKFPRGYTGYVDKSKKRTAWDYYVNTPRKSRKPLDTE